MELFDKLISPIVLYNSEVWGTSFLPCNSNRTNIFGYAFLGKHLVEKLHLTFLKIIIGVHSKTTNWEIINENPWL